MSKRIVVMALALLVSLASFASAQEAAKTTKSDDAKSEAAVKAPRLTVIEPVKDYGEVAKGDKLSWSFVVKNTGDADLQILAAKPGCGCTVAEFDKVIKPGETGKIATHVDTTAFAGPISKTVTIETNDPSVPAATLTIHAIVKPYVEAYPAGFVRYNLIRGAADTQSVTIYSEEEEPFQITKIETPGDWVKVVSTKIEDRTQLAPAGRAGQNQYRLDITVGGPDAKIGPLADKIHLQTNSSHQPDYFISVSGVIRPPYRVDPSGVNMGEITPTDSSATRSVVIKSNNLKAPETFNVTKVESSTSSLVTTVKPTDKKGEYELTVAVAKDAKPGELAGTVKIFTNDKVTPVYELPVKAMIKSPTASK